MTMTLLKFHEMLFSTRLSAGVRETRAVAAAARVGVLGVVDVGVAEDAAERAVDGDAATVADVGLDVLDPASTGEAHVDVPAAVAALAAVEVQVLDAGVAARPSRCSRRAARGCAVSKPMWKGVVKVTVLPADARDLQHLGDGPVDAREPAARDRADGRLGGPLR